MNVLFRRSVLVLTAATVFAAGCQVDLDAEPSVVGIETQDRDPADDPDGDGGGELAPPEDIVALYFPGQELRVLVSYVDEVVSYLGLAGEDIEIILFEADQQHELAFAEDQDEASRVVRNARCTKVSDGKRGACGRWGGNTPDTGCSLIDTYDVHKCRAGGTALCAEEQRVKAYHRYWRDRIDCTGPADIEWEPTTWMCEGGP